MVVFSKSFIVIFTNKNMVVTGGVFYYLVTYIVMFDVSNVNIIMSHMRIEVQSLY